MKKRHRYDMYGVRRLDRALSSPSRDVAFVLTREFDYEGQLPDEEAREVEREAEATFGAEAGPSAFYYTYTRGVDWETIVLCLYAVFITGPKLRDALQAWGDMARRVVGLWKRLMRKHKALVYFHPTIAGAVAMSWLRGKSSRARKSDLHVLSVTELPTYRAPSLDDPFRYTPERVYVVAVEERPADEADQYRLHTITLTSAGTVAGHAVVPVHIWPGPGVA